MLTESELVKIGREGERLTANVLRKVFGDQVRLYNNLYFTDSKGKPYQVDSLALTPWGLLVIETKHWNGSVYGKVDAERWRYVPHGRHMRARTVYSPIRQNRGHVGKLRGTLGRALPMYSCIVFSHHGVEARLST